MSVAGDFYGLAGKKIGQHSRCADGQQARSLPPLLAMEPKGSDLKLGHRPPSLLFFLFIHSNRWRFTENSTNGDNLRIVAQNGAQIIRRQNGGAQDEVRPSNQ